ncbi:methyltransferase domain-containing protein [Streptomyces sp. NPDC048301]|uniref:SAM-dependent methyltransferase n=1 Tax=unclassified Streptomyces TaxID=2593676 RepID=UPI003445D842
MSASPAHEHAWTVYGQRQLDHGYTPPVPERIDWAFDSDDGPGAEALGPIRGKRVLDIGSGPGHHAVHLARSHGALVDGVDLSPTQHRRAIRSHGCEPRVRFFHCDVAEHLRRTQPYEAAYSVRSFACIDPLHLLPALRCGLAANAPLVFSALHTDDSGLGPSDSVATRELRVRLRDDEPIPVRMWVLAPRVWEELLTGHGFTVEAVDLLSAPSDDNPAVLQLVRARRTEDPTG